MFIKRIVSVVLSLLIVIPMPMVEREVYADGIVGLPQISEMMLPSRMYNPVIMKGLKVYPEESLRFDFVIDSGDLSVEDEVFRVESNKVIKYFFTAMTIQEDSFWVNLSPYEENRIIPHKFGQTEMGRDLLIQDYVLKQIMASLTNPNNDLGKIFWDRIYSKAYDLGEDMDIVLSMLSRVWIVPESPVIYEEGNAVYITDTYFKVMLEEDYLMKESNLLEGDVVGKEIEKGSFEGRVNGLSLSSIMRDIVISELEKEVNEGKIFANLRQIYHSMVLAIWFKRNVRNEFLGEVYVDKEKIEGVEVKDKKVIEKIYERYKRSFEIGVYDFIEEEYDASQQDIVLRKYFSGGVSFDKGVLNRSGKYPQHLNSGIPTIFQVEIKALSRVTEKQKNDVNKRIIDIYKSKLFLTNKSKLLRELKIADHQIFNRRLINDEIDKIKEGNYSGFVNRVDLLFYVGTVFDKEKDLSMNDIIGFINKIRLSGGKEYLNNIIKEIEWFKDFKIVGTEDKFSKKDILNMVSRNESFDDKKKVIEFLLRKKGLNERNIFKTYVIKHIISAEGTVTEKEYLINLMLDSEFIISDIRDMFYISDPTERQKAVHDRINANGNNDKKWTKEYHKYLSDTISGIFSKVENEPGGTRYSKIKEIYGLRIDGISVFHKNVITKSIDENNIDDLVNRLKVLLYLKTEFDSRDELYMGTIINFINKVRLENGDRKFDEIKEEIEWFTNSESVAIRDNFGKKDILRIILREESLTQKKEFMYFLLNKELPKSYTTFMPFAGGSLSQIKEDINDMIELKFSFSQIFRLFYSNKTLSARRIAINNIKKDSLKIFSDQYVSMLSDIMRKINDSNSETNRYDLVKEIEKILYRTKRIVGDRELGSNFLRPLFSENDNNYIVERLKLLVNLVSITDNKKSILGKDLICNIVLYSKEGKGKLIIQEVTNFMISNNVKDSRELANNIIHLLIVKELLNVPNMGKHMDIADVYLFLDFLRKYYDKYPSEKTMNEFINKVDKLVGLNYERKLNIDQLAGGMKYFAGLGLRDTLFESEKDFIEFLLDNKIYRASYLAIIISSKGSNANKKYLIKDLKSSGMTNYKIRDVFRFLTYQDSIDAIAKKKELEIRPTNPSSVSETEKTTIQDTKSVSETGKNTKNDIWSSMKGPEHYNGSGGERFTYFETQINNLNKTYIMYEKNLKNAVRNFLISKNDYFVEDLVNVILSQKDSDVVLNSVKFIDALDQIITDVESDVFNKADILYIFRYVVNVYNEINIEEALSKIEYFLRLQKKEALAFSGSDIVDEVFSKESFSDMKSFITYLRNLRNKNNNPIIIDEDIMFLIQTNGTMSYDEKKIIIEYIVDKEDFDQFKMLEILSTYEDFKVTNALIILLMDKGLNLGQTIDVLSAFPNIKDVNRIARILVKGSFLKGEQVARIFSSELELEVENIMKYLLSKNKNNKLTFTGEEFTKMIVDHLDKLYDFFSNHLKFKQLFIGKKPYGRPILNDKEFTVMIEDLLEEFYPSLISFVAFNKSFTEKANNQVIIKDKIVKGIISDNLDFLYRVLLGEVRMKNFLVVLRAKEENKSYNDNDSLGGIDLSRNLQLLRNNEEDSTVVLVENKLKSLQNIKGFNHIILKITPVQGFMSTFFE